jgi:glucosamine--fructose-6-phosphate aminotransferase (isomerizing)
VAENEAVTPGSGMAADIGEQPDGYATLLAASAGIAQVAQAIIARQPKHVVFVARGTSDHAALYGLYLTETRLGLSASLASPSTMTLYGARPDLSHALVIGVSQSGKSPDLVEVTRIARESGALTLAITNAPESELATTAELHIDVLSGHERAVAATKTYTGELMALLLLVEAVRGGGSIDAEERTRLDAIPQLAADTLADAGPQELAKRYRYADRLVTTGRGYAYATAKEAALKIIETSYLSALAYSGADFLHGPVAVAGPKVPVFAVVGGGPGGKSMGEVLDRLASRHAEVVAVSPFEDARASLRLWVPEVDERYSPLLDILPLQRLALAISLGRGGNPDAPEGLTKVTHTL